VLDQSFSYKRVAAGGDLGDWYGGDFSLALRSDGTVWGWGSDAHGQLGDGQSAGDVGTSAFTKHAVQALLPAGVSIAAISAGQDHSLALTAAGTVYSWGSNSSGELGNGTGGDGSLSELSDVPVAVSNLNNVTAISAGDGFSLALKSDGTVWAWGADDVGEAGQSNLKGVLTPKQVTNLSNVIAISASDGDSYGSNGHQHALGLEADGTVWAWGANDYGELGNGNTGGYSATPARVQGLTGITAIAAGQNFSLAARGKRVWAWGRNDAGQLGGFGKPTSPPQPTPVLAFSDWFQNVVAIDAGGPFAEIIADPYEWFPPQKPQVIYVGQGGSKKIVLRDLPASATDPIVGVRASAPFRRPQLEIIANGDPAGPAGGPLPHGAACTSACGLSVTVSVPPTAAVGRTRGTITLVYADGSTVSRSVPFGVTRVVPISIVTGALPKARVDQRYRVLLGASGGFPPYRWKLQHGQLPHGLVLNATTGQISGQPTTSAVTRKITIAVTDHRITSSATSHTAKVTLTLRVP
jgi:hypothetical protein